MATLAELQAWRAALERARFAGLRSVTSGNKSTEYRSDAEMAAELAELDRQIARASGSPRVSQVRLSFSKGF